MSKTILAFHSSYFDCSISLLHNNNIYHENKKCNQNQTIYILPMIKNILKINFINLHEIKIIAISTGPGNFIGIRTSIAIAQGLSLGLNIPIVTLPAPLIMAEQVWKTLNKNRVLMISKKNNQDMYLEKYVKREENFWIKKKSKKILSIKEVQKKLSSLRKSWTIIGNYSKLISKNIYKNLIFSNIYSPNAQFIITLYLSNKRYQKSSLSYKIFPRYF
ncbi:MAG: tRNA (adenosine(37)-N6)-threonylcarbamoyltransferase complex dimerization subunit type 1 TsaB [Buchnera aphidicola (Nurudea yanoniella)]